MKQDWNFRRSKESFIGEVWRCSRTIQLKGLSLANNSSFPAAHTCTKPKIILVEYLPPRGFYSHSLR